MADFMFCVRSDGIDETALRGERGLDHAGSDKLEGRGAEPHDVLWIVRCPGKDRLRLIGRIVIANVTSRGDAETTLGRPLYVREEENGVKKPRTFVLARTDELDVVVEQDISDLAPYLTFDKKAGASSGYKYSAQLKRGFDGRDLQTPRILTTEGAILIEDRWAQGRNAGGR